MHLLRQLHPFFRIHQAHHFIRRRRHNRNSPGIINSGFSPFSFFRGNHDHAVCCLHAIDSRSTRVFQNIYPFNIIRVQTGNSVPYQIHPIHTVQFLRRKLYRFIQNNTIHYPHGFPVSRDRRRSPNPNFRGGSRRRCLIQNGDSCQTPL